MHTNFDAFAKALANLDEACEAFDEASQAFDRVFVSLMGDVDPGGRHGRHGLTAFEAVEQAAPEVAAAFDRRREELEACEGLVDVTYPPLLRGVVNHARGEPERRARAVAAGGRHIGRGAYDFGPVILDGWTWKPAE